MTGYTRGASAQDSCTLTSRPADGGLCPRRLQIGVCLRRPARDSLGHASRLDRTRTGAAFSFLRYGGNTRKATKGTADMSKVVRMVFIAALGCAALGLLAAPAVQHYYCKYCGLKTTSVNSLTSLSCQRHPNGPGKGRHALYEGGEKTTYVCKYCGLKSISIASLTSSKCQRHPNGPQKGRHEPAL